MPTLSEPYMHRQRWISVIFDIILVAFSLLLAYTIRYDFSLTQHIVDQYLRVLPIAIISQLLLFWAFGVYRSIWRYSGPSDLLLILQGALLNLLVGVLFQVGIRTYTVSPRFQDLLHSMVQPVFHFFFIGFEPSQLLFSYSILIIHGLLTVMFIGGIRLLARLWVEMKRKEQVPTLKRLLIIGSGNESETVLRELRRNPALPYHPVGMVTETGNRLGLRIHGVRILGGISDIPRLIEQLKVDEILMALPSHSGKIVREVVDLCDTAKIKIRTIPSMEDMMEGKIRFNQFPEIRPEDFLGRDQVNIHTKEIAEYITGQKVLVTGAGGSIGSELCRQISQLNPSQLILLGRGENSIWEIETELRHYYPTLNIYPVICDIRDKERIESVFAHFQPQVVFHAAAHKHVPMMELNPGEAIKNNVLGTQNVAEAAVRHSAKRFIMISTDKAINPANVMGASKRIAEKVIQSIARTSTETRFAIVRFGNVLASRGSVIILFQKQILWGGPVTVTHPEATRYFMSIPEAVKLVIQAGAIGSQADIFALNMGEPIRMVDVARNLINLAGLELNRDIEVQYTGLRAGEKLIEESVTMGEGIQITEYHDLFRLPTQKPPSPDFIQQIDQLAMNIQECMDPAKVLDELNRLAD